MLFILYLTRAGERITRQDLGVPKKWETIESWFDGSRGVVKPAVTEPRLPELKNPEISVLASYESKPGNEFWKTFPTHYPEKISKKVNVPILKQYVDKCWNKWSYAKKKVAKQSMDRLDGKVPVALQKELKGIMCKNAKSAVVNGRFMTDTIGSWIKKKYVAGPFDQPPMRGFRVNPLMAVVQKTKVRPIMNLSSPKGESFNDAVDMACVQKLTMSSPRLFADSLIRYGQGSKFAKSDIQDAYKLVPVPIEEWQLYGFKWLGKVFFDTTLVFGSKCAPANFDCMAETIVNIVCTEENISKTKVHRQLDDVPVVSAKHSGETERFAAKYREVCKNCQIPLAEECPDREKAFGTGTFGTVLGVNFDSEIMEWSLSSSKEEGLQKSLDDFMAQNSCNLKDVQKIHGKMANFAQACEFMKGFRFNLLQMLTKFVGCDESRKLIGQAVKDDLWVWKKAISTALEGIPLGDIFGEPPLTVVRYLSDAAGAAFEWTDGQCKNITEEGDRGVASIGYGPRGPTSVSILRWPEGLLTKSKTQKGTFFGSKSGTLEMVGLLLPFLSTPKLLIGKHIVLEVDNMGVVYGWKKRYSKGDAETSLLIRCLHVLEALLECKIYVTHVKRCSNHMAKMADSLSRQATSTQDVLDAVAGLEKPVISQHLMDWLRWPALNWDLPYLLCKDVKTLLDLK
jgi:hypothetical protein